MTDQYQGYTPPPGQQYPQQQYPQQPEYQQQQPQYYQQPAAQHQPAPQTEFYQQQAVGSTAGISSVDSLSSNEFVVEIDGERATGIFAVSGLSSYSLKMEDGKPVGMDFPAIVITKMVQQDSNLAFNRWTRETVAARGTRLPTRTVAIIAMDEGAETRRWIYHKAWISNIRFSDFDTALDFLIEEKITIQHGGVEEVWTR
ncbi:MAG: hypothetical protein F9K46_06265 [Anaerolineae bacterium]|nr:MAG: hypothetical protein F9K46_06265 [Anaerolineae bacterium]